MLKITSIKSKPYKQFFRYNIKVEAINEDGDIIYGAVPSITLEYIKNLKVGDSVNFVEIINKTY